MITGIGLEIVEIERIEKINARGEAFRKKILTEQELTTYETLSTHRQIEFLAGRFAAKEAFSKALGTGIGKSCSWLDIEVRKTESGQPILFFKQALVHGFISITHTKQYAAAQVVLEK